ncbi:MAG TPA: molybdopterin-binding protein [Dissulfurispiraceae bacterium]|nr:molybdopterin-binding protein [Dissulfurispiraceae bacterium]
MKVVAVKESIGTVLCHDLTQIVPDVFKGPAFRKGHIIREDDIPRLLDMGKEHLYVFEMQDGLLHENDAARRIAAAAGGYGLFFSEPKEGKIDFVTQTSGLLKVNVAALNVINESEEIVLVTLHSNQPVREGRIVAGTRIIPLIIDETKIERIESICASSGAVIEIKPLRTLKAGIITTGSEVFHGRIKDGFGPVVKKKLEDMECPVMQQIFVSDSVERIAGAVHRLIADGAELIVVTGGMSVDPDDVTPAGLRAAGVEVITYGAPVLPGAMFMLGYIGKIPVMGLPGCVMYHKTTVFDLVLPRILTGERLTRADIACLAHGGLCTVCATCRYPDCSFGKGA